jgi:hypothetical protein
VEAKLKRLTGRSWKRTAVKQLQRNAEGRGILVSTALFYYLNEDTAETVWERPRVIDAETERAQTRAGGYGGLPHAVLARIARFAQHTSAFRLVCRAWW